MSLLPDNTLGISLIVLVALGATALLRGRSAALRHWVLAVAIVCALFAPLVSLIVPSWRFGLDRWPSSSPADQAARSGSVVDTAIVDVSGVALRQEFPEHLAGGGHSGPTMAALFDWLGPIWLAGTCASFLVLLVGLARLKWLASTARRVERGAWVELTSDISRAIGLQRRVVLLESDHPTLLATWGLVRPRVILPAAASTWTEDRVQVVLRHELAHIRRGDWVAQIASEVLRSLFWFNPLVWIACARLRQESEYACDDAVLEAGVDGADYADHLVDLARALNAKRRVGLAALAMARPSSLKGRVSAMLNARIDRTPLTRLARASTVVALLSLTLPIAALGAQSTFVTITGSVMDGTNRVLPGVTLTLTNTTTEAKHEVKSNSTGRFEFVGVPGGEYVLVALQAGFEPFRDKLTVAGRNIDRNIELQLGTLQETINVVDGAPTKPAPTPEKVQEMLQKGKDRVQRALEKCSVTDVVPGGNILVPMKLVDVRPRYPENLKSAGVGGVVILDTIIGTDGSVKDVQAVNAPDPDLEAAAAEAVRQWQFSATVLNCTLTDVPMRVTVTFKIQP